MNLNSILIFFVLILLRHICEGSISQLNCDFDRTNDYCNWSPASSQPSNWRWSQFSGRTVNFTGPMKPIDNQGSFIISYDRNSGGTIEPTATLVSPLIEAIKTPTCFQFFYFIHGVGVDRIELTVLNMTNNEESPIWARKFPAGDMWHSAHIHIPPHNSTFKLKFSAFAGGGAIALDRFIGVQNQCPFDGECDFESGWCDWISLNSSTNKYKFNLITARDEEDNSIMIDHTTQTEYGHLLQARNGQINDTAIIMKNIPSIYSTKCFKFWYYRQRSLRNWVQVLLFGSFNQNISIWNSSLTYPSQRWHRALVTVSVPDHFGDALKLGISAIHLDPMPMYSPINVDDTSFQLGSCPQPITCDFNKDLCGFVHNMGIDDNGTSFWVWDHGFGRVEYGSKLKFKYPPEDRTAPSDGMFLYTDFTSVNTLYGFRVMRIDSEYVSPTPASCLSFYYMAIDTTSNSTIFAVNSYDNSEKVKQNLWTYTPKNDSNYNKQIKSWIKVNIDINTVQEFRISFEVSTYVPNTYIALDDVSYKLGKCSSIKSTTISPIPTSTITIPHQKQVSCDFESGDFCGWQQNGAQPWLINQVDNQFSSLRPSTDHTLKNSNGRYAYIEHIGIEAVIDKKAIMTISDNFIIQSKYLGQSCLSLWYYMRADIYAQLEVSSYQNMPLNVIKSTTRSNDWGEKWNLLRFQTYQDSNSNLFNITAYVKNGFVAIDDIKISHNPCSQLNDNSFQCNFEEESCRFGTLYTRNTVQWKLVKGTELNHQLVDHTLRTTFGHMMAMDGKFDDTMASQWFSPTTQGSCLSFAYLMTGLKNNETLNLRVIKESSLPFNMFPIMWSVSNDLGDIWYIHRLTIVSDLRWRIAFTGVSNNSKINPNTGIMAIDDINIEFDKPCPPPGKCDFESGDTCMWQNQKPTVANSLSNDQKLRVSQLDVNTISQSTILEQSDFTWTVHSPRRAPMSQYPSFDHTTGISSGYYLHLKADGPRVKGNRAILMSDRYDIDPQNRVLCLSLYYYFINSVGLGETQLDIYQSEHYSSVKKIAKIMTPINQINDWMPFNLTIKPLDINSTNIWFYLVGTIINVYNVDTTSYGVNLAIDDISITTGVCPIVDNMFSCTPTERIPKTKVCNKVKDCSNGFDEKVCGDCDFENNFLCGYQITWSYNNPKDNNLYKWRFGDYSNGPKSGFNHSNGYIIARRLGININEPDGQSDLITPMINGAQAGCFVNFKYNIKRDPQFSGPNSTLSVLLRAQNGFEMTEIWNSDAFEHTFSEWMSGSAYLKRIDYNYSLVFRARDSGQTPESYVAIDSIIFNDCDKPLTRTGLCDSRTHFQCSIGGCLSKYYVCDYSNDCGDNSDENLCSDYIHRTDFENGWSVWKSSGVPGWQLATGSYNLIEGQTRDHTIGTGKGHFAYLSSNTSNTAKTVSLIGPVVPPNKDCTIRLWTDIVGNASLTLKLLNLKTRIFSKQMTEYQPINTFTYERQIISLNIDDVSSSYLIYLEGRVGPKNTINSKSFLSYIAIDDISLSPECITKITAPTGVPVTAKPSLDPCPADKPFSCNPLNSSTLDRMCIKMEYVCDFNVDCPANDDEKYCGSCSFDKNNMCGWNNIGDSRQEWSLQNANRFANHPIIPNYDSTGNKSGAFIIIDTSKGGTYNTEAIMSTPILGSTAANCKLTFYYHHWIPENLMEPKSSVLTIKLNYPKINAQKTIAEIRKRANVWTKASVPIGSISSGFQVWISAKGQMSDQTGSFADIELDNIQFVHCDDTDANWNTDIDCDFELGTCGWTDTTINTNSKLDWTRERSSNVDPGYDHTSRIRPRPQQYGYWMRTRREPGMSGNNTATLITVAAFEVTNSYCLTFWYHMWGSNLAQFELVMNQYKSEVGGKVLWIKRAPQSNNWIKESITVQNSSPYYLMFRATLQPQNGRHEDSIGLDDIKWTEGQCPNQPICDFETNLCGWISKNKLWVKTIPSDFSDKTLKPRVDHTLGLESGAYMRLSATNQNSELIYTFKDSTPLNDSTPYPQRSMCLKFWYYRSTTSPYQNKLDLIEQSNSPDPPFIFSRWTINDFAEFGIFNEQWMFARANLTLTNNDIIKFEGQITDSKSIIALDDILLQSHPCEPIGWCDFESDFCGWSNAWNNAVIDSNKKSILWLRNSGSTTSTLNGPKTDHTTQTMDGWYAFVPSDSQQSGTAILMSEPISYSVLFSSPNGTVEVIDTISSSASNQWKVYNVTHEFKNVPRYRLMLKTLEGNISQSDIAIDDIQVWFDTCADVAIKSRLVSTQSPISTTRIPIIEKAFDCDFETNVSKWSSYPSGDWVVTHWQQGVSTIGPRIDHTIRTSDGHYLLFKPKSNPLKLLYSKFISSVMPFTDTPNCLSFWYYSDSESYFNITVSSLQTTLFMAPTMTSNSWKQIRVQLPIQPNISVSIAVVYQKLLIGALAIDDITLIPGQCPLSGQVCGFSYNYCGFKPDRILPPNGPYIGYLANEAILKNYKLNGPVYDHTTRSTGNYFIFTNYINDTNTNYRTDLIIGNLSPTQYQSSCLKFWYQITGQTSNIQIYVVPINQFRNYQNAKWTALSQSHTHWTMGQLTFRARFQHKIVFSLTKSKDNNYIALDDISISDGACESPVSCDFDVDSCDWYDLNFQDSNWKWGRFTGPPTDPWWPGPPLDHTLNKVGGTYLYMTAYGDNSTTLNQRNAYLESMPVPSNQSYCLSFYTQVIGNESTLLISAISYGNFSPTTFTQILGSEFKTTLQKWTKFSVKFDPKMFNKSHEVSFLIKGSITKPNNFIALDDISLNANYMCDTSPQESYTCSDGKQINLNSVCNFAKDCSKGEDESNCGTCDFESGLCGWTNTFKKNNQLWIRKSADNRTLPNGPTVDGQSKPNGYYMMIAKQNIGVNKRALLESSAYEIYRFKGSHTTCRMYFDYFINGSDATLRVIVREGPTSFNYVWRTIGSTLLEGEITNLEIINPFWKKRATVDIGEHRSTFTVQIEGDIRNPTQIIAIDDITFESCGAVNSTLGACPNEQFKCPMDAVCIDQFSLCDGINDCGTPWDESPQQCIQLSLPKCDFESNTKCPQIFTIESDSHTHWFLVNTALNNNLDRKTGPVNDHTYRLMGKGIYLALNGSAGSERSRSRFVSFWVQSSGEKCAIRLFYYMYGSYGQMGSLRIYGRNSTTNPIGGVSSSSRYPFEVQGDLGQQWFRAIVTVDTSMPFQFVIEGLVGTGNEADIAIDDISFSRGCVRAGGPFVTTVSPTSNSPTNKQQTSSQRDFTTTKSSVNPLNSKTTQTLIPTSVPNSVSKNTRESTLTTIASTGTSQSSTPGKQIGDKGKTGPESKGIGPYGLAASISVPIILIIAAVIGVIFYRKYRINRTEEGTPLNPTVIDLTERNH